MAFVDAYMETEDAYEAARSIGIDEMQLDHYVEMWRNHPTTLAMIEHKRLAKASKENVEKGWLISEIKSVYLRSKDRNDCGNALKALDMLSKHVGLYAADKSPQQEPITVVIKNFAGIQLDNQNDGIEE